MAVNKVLINRDDGFALYSEVEQFEDGTHSEGGRQLTPDDIVDGKPVRDWPTGVFKVKKYLYRVEKPVAWRAREPRKRSGLMFITRCGKLDRCDRRRMYARSLPE